MSPSREREEAGHAEIGNQLTCTRGSETDGGGRADQEVIPPLARCSLRCKHDDATRQIPVRIAAFSSPYLARCQPVTQPCQSNRDPCQPVRDPCQPVRHPNLEEYGTPKHTFTSCMSRDWFTYQSTQLWVDLSSPSYGCKSLVVIVSPKAPPPQV